MKHNLNILLLTYFIISLFAWSRAMMDFIVSCLSYLNLTFFFSFIQLLVPV